MKKNTRGFIQIAIIILMSVLALGTVGYFAYTNGQKNPKIITDKKFTEVTPTVEESLTPTAILEITSKPSPTSSNNKLFNGTSFIYTNSVYSGYTLSYPSNCVAKTSALICTLNNGQVQIDINAGGHGGEIMKTKVIRNNETKIIPAGEGKISLIENLDTKKAFGTYWINKTDALTQEPIFGFEFRDISETDIAEFEKLLDTILNSFKFIEK